MNRTKALLLTAVLLLPVVLGADDAPGEDFLPFLFVAFAITWLAFFVYAFFMSRKQADLKREIDALREQQDGDGGS